MTDISPEVARQVLDLPLPDDNDAEAATVREYLIALLRGVWIEREGFSGKRPFGNSGWNHDLYEPLIKADLIQGSYDEDGYVENVDRRAGDRMILAAINELGRPSPTDPTT